MLSELQTEIEYAHYQGNGINKMINDNTRKDFIMTFDLIYYENYYGG